MPTEGFSVEEPAGECPLTLEAAVAARLRREAGPDRRPRRKPQCACVEGDVLTLLRTLCPACRALFPVVLLLPVQSALGP